MGAELTAIEYVFPEKVVTNEELKIEFPEYDFKKFESKVGIAQRYVASENETAITLAIKAVEKLFANSNISKNDVDFILYCTQSPEYILPTSACLIQSACGIKSDVGALDFNLGCSGYTYGLHLAKMLIDNKNIQNVLLITSETYSKYINPLDRTNRSIFGDAATASMVTYSESNCIGEFLFGTDGTGYKDLIIKNGAGHSQFNPSATLKSYGSENYYTDNNLYMNGPAVFNFTSEIIPAFTEKVLKINKIEIESIKQFIFHQANAFMLNLLRRKIGIDKAQFYVDLRDGGNTVSNTIPIALKRYITNNNTIQKGDEVLLMGFGVGLSWSGGVIKINNLK